MSNQSVRANIEELIANGLQALSLEDSVAIGAAEEEDLDFPFVEFVGAVPQFSAVGDPDSNFDFTVTTVNTADASFDAIIDLITAVTAQAIQNWAAVIVGAEGAVLDVAVAIADLGPGTVASASSGSLFLGDPDLNGFQEILAGTQIELITGVDPNGEAPDININVSTDFIQAAIDAGTLDISFATDPDRSAPPAGVLDFVSVLTHEVFHGLGFFAFRDPSGADVVFDLGAGPVSIESTYGTQVTFAEENGFLTPRFNGENVVELYGEGTILETTVGPGSDISHFAAFNPDGTLSDLVFDIENPFVIAGDIVDIGALDLGLLRDLGYETIVDDRGLVNTLDFVPSEITPTVSIAPELSVVNGEVVATLTLSSVLFAAVPSSVGLEITTSDGTSQSQRVIFTPGSLETMVVLSDDILSAIGDGGDISLRLFFPAQAALGNGLNEETVSVAGIDIGDIINGTDGNDRIVGTNDDDAIFSGEGNDNLIGLRGDDLLVGGGGNDRIIGNAGDDTLNGGDGDDNLISGSGDDVNIAGDGNNRVVSGNGDDFISAGSGNDTLISGNGDDTVTAGDGNNRVVSGNGNDSIATGAGRDTLFSGNGDDTIFSGSGNDRIFSGNGSDIINSGAGNDTIFTSSGNDVINAGAGNDRINTGAGNDTIIFSFGGQDDSDIVTSFDDSRDNIVIDGFDFSSVDEVLAASFENDNDVVILLDEATNQTVRIRNTDLDELSADNVSLIDSSVAATAASTATQAPEELSFSLFSNAVSTSAFGDNINFDLFRTTLTSSQSRSYSDSLNELSHQEIFTANVDDFLFQEELKDK